MDQGIQSAITFLFINRISKTLSRMNRLPMRQNHLLSSFVGSSWKKIQRLLWNNGISLQNVQNYSFVDIHLIHCFILHMHCMQIRRRRRRDQYQFLYLCCRRSRSITIHKKVYVDRANRKPCQLGRQAITIVPFTDMAGSKVVILRRHPIYAVPGPPTA